MSISLILVAKAGFMLRPELSLLALIVMGGAIGGGARPELDYLGEILGFVYSKLVPLSTLSKSAFGVTPMFIGGANLGEVAGDSLGIIPNASPNPPTDKLLLLAGTSFSSSGGKLNANAFDWGWAAGAGCCCG